MARIRSIKVDLFVDDSLADVSVEAHLLLAGLPCIADSEGRLEDRPKRIQAMLMPYRPAFQMAARLTELHDAGAIIRYEVGGVPYIQIANWDRDQRPHVKEPASTIPPTPPGYTEPRQFRAELVQGGELAGNSPGTRRGENAGIKDSGSGILDSGLGASATQETSPVSDGGFALTPPPASKRRQLSKAEALFARIQLSRQQRCEDVGEPFIAESWPAQRQNRDLKPILAAEDGLQARFEAAWALFLGDDGNKALKPAWSFAYFMSSGVRAKYETMAAREEAA